MKKVLYGIFAISALAATSAWAAPVQVGVGGCEDIRGGEAGREEE